MCITEHATFSPVIFMSVKNMHNYSKYILSDEKTDHYFEHCQQHDLNVIMFTERRWDVLGCTRLLWLALLCQQRINLWFYVNQLFSHHFLPAVASSSPVRTKTVFYTAVVLYWALCLHIQQLLCYYLQRISSPKGKISN